MSKPFDWGLFCSTVYVCNDHDVPKDLTLDAAVIIASDQAGEPNLGRTTKDQEIIDKVLPYLQSGGKQ